MGQAANAATQTTNLINFQNSLLTIENNLVRTWLSYVTGRLVLFRDLGTLPFDEWEAYRELFPTEPTGPDDPVRAEGAPRTASPRPAQAVAR